MSDFRSPNQSDSVNPAITSSLFQAGWGKHPSYVELYYLFWEDGTSQFDFTIPLR